MCTIYTIAALLFRVVSCMRRSKWKPFLKFEGRRRAATAAPHSGAHASPICLYPFSWVTIKALLTLVAKWSQHSYRSRTTMPTCATSVATLAMAVGSRASSHKEVCPFAFCPLLPPLSIQLKLDTISYSDFAMLGYSKNMYFWHHWNISIVLKSLNFCF